MSANSKVKSFLHAVCDKMGFRFAVELHHALKDGRDDGETRGMLRQALKAIQN